MNTCIRQIIVLLIAPICFSQSKQEIREAKERRDKFLFSVEASPKKFNTTVNVDYVLDELLIPVIINGKTYNFIFDTGAITVISSELAADLNLKPVSSNKLMDAAGVTTQQDIFILADLSVSGVTFSKVGCAAMPLDSFSTLLCKKVDGLFGTNIMRLGNWKIDYINHSITLSTNSIKTDFDYETVDFEHSFSDSPIIYLITGDARFRALLDSGNNRYIDVPDTIYKQTKLPHRSITRKSFGRASYSLSGNIDQSELAVLTDSLYFGDKLMRQQRLRINPGSQVLIGNKFLKQFGKFIISWNKSEIYIPKQTLPQEKELTFGFTPFIENEKLTVVEIWDDSDAKNKGLQINDIILKVNDLDIRTATPERYCEFTATTKNMNSITIDIQKSDGSLKTLQLDRFELLKSN